MVRIMLMAVLLSAFAFADSSGLFFHSVIWDEETDDQQNEIIISSESTGFQTIVVDNGGSQDGCGTGCDEERIVYDDVSVKVFVPELGAYVVSRPFDVDDNIESSKVLLDLGDAEPGEYTARIIVSNDFMKRVVHRFFFIN